MASLYLGHTVPKQPAQPPFALSILLLTLLIYILAKNTNKLNKASQSTIFSDSRFIAGYQKSIRPFPPFFIFFNLLS